MRAKKFCAVALTLCMLATTGCQGKSNDDTKSATTEATTVEATEATEATTTEAVATKSDAAIPSLKEIYKDDFLIGTIYAESSLNEKDVALMDSQFNVITPENIMKPEGMQNVEGNFTFGAADKMVDFAKEHDLLVVGHNLAWHQQSPSWMAADKEDRDKAIEQLKAHITSVVEHYKGDLISWDVVNEAIEDGRSLPADGDWTKCLRKNQWYNAIGPEYLAMAFKFAKEADPDCKLYYNDYNLELQQKADVAYAMIKEFKEQGVPIDGIGIQGHMQTGVPVGGLDYALNLFSTLDIEISVTELDVTYNNPSGPVLTEEEAVKQGITYAQIFKTLKTYSDKIERVTFWGTVDSQSWRGDSFPCIFDSLYQPKEAFYAVADPEGYLAEHAADLGILPALDANAAYGTPTVDGEVDDIWASAEEIKINRQVMAWEGATGTAQVLWDENNLYVLVHVKDDVLDATSENDYEHDSVELFVDLDNAKSASYGADDGQYRINYEGKITFGTVPTEDGVQGFAVKEDGGYRVEMLIPLSSPVEAGQVIGFDAQVNDAKEGARIAVAKFCDSTDNSYMTTENFGNLTLVK